MTELVNTIKKEMKINNEVIYKEPRLGDLRRLVGGVSMAKELFGFKTNVSFSEGISQTVKWYMENIER